MEGEKKNEQEKMEGMRRVYVGNGRDMKGLCREWKGYEGIM